MTKIIIDPGHGGTNHGCSHVHNGELVYENTVVLTIGLKVRRMLAEMGYEVYITRKENKSVKNGSRPYVVPDADCFVSIHINAPAKAGDTKTCGFCSLTRYDVGAGYNLCDYVNTHLVNCLNRYFEAKGVDHTAKNLGVWHGKRFPKSLKLPMLRGSMPSCLVECGFVTHPVEGAMLLNDDYLWQIAYGIANGVNAFLRSKR